MGDMHNVLTPIQRAIADRVLDEEERARHHLVVALSGAHAYGFPSPDSDLDLKAIHVEPTDRLVGLSPPPADASRMEVIEGVEIDYTSNEIYGVLRGILRGNGNYIERVLGAYKLRAVPELAELAELVRASLSRRVHHHYRGFATAQREEWEQGGARSAKKLLYVLRTTLTGTHLLATGALVADVTALFDEHGFGAARELVELKRAGERTELAPEVTERWRGEIARAFELLDAALVRSPLPEEPPNVAEIGAWLIVLRRNNFASADGDADGDTR